MSDAVEALAIEAAEAAYLTSRVAALLAIKGNPHRAGLRTESSLQGFLVQATPSPMSNRICGNPEDAPDAFTALLDWFSDHGCNATVPRIIRNGKPPKSHRIGTHELQRINGWTHVQLACAIDGLPSLTTDVEVKEVTAESVGVLADIHAEAFQTPTPRALVNRASFAGLLSNDCAKGFLAQIEGVAVAGAIVYFAGNGVAYLGTAATRRGARSRGCHAALIECRIGAARKHGSQVVAATAAAKSQSRRNLERFGLAASHFQTLYQRGQ